MAGKDDKDWLFLDNTIAIAIDIQELMAWIIELSDNPAVVRRAIDAKHKAITIQDRAKNYRPRLRELKGENGNV